MFVMFSCLVNARAPGVMWPNVTEMIALRRFLDYACELPKFTESLREVKGKNYNDMRNYDVPSGLRYANRLCRFCNTCGAWWSWTEITSGMGRVGRIC